jgi:hypothetical protein
MNQSEGTFSTHGAQAPALEEYDLVILGSGTGSTLAAWTFAGQGKRCGNRA